MVDALAAVAEATEEAPRGSAWLVDQLRRAALSIMLNIAEGAGRYAGGDSARFFSIARGSAMESGAALDACRLLRIITEERYQRASAVLKRTVEMLTRMCR